MEIKQIKGTDVNKEMEKSYKGVKNPTSDWIFKYTSIINHPYKKYICFVEGNTDKRFYKGCLYKICNVSQDEIFFIHGSKDENDDVKGKKAVLEMFKYCEQIKKRKIHTFIIDKDYENIENVLTTPEQKEGITVLPCYSFENFYLQKENLKAVLKQFFEGNIDLIYSDFINNCNKFMQVIVEYCACKKASIFHECKEISIRSTVEKAFRQVNFDKTNMFDENILKEIKKEINEWKLKANPLLYKEYEKFLNELKNNISDIKGKILFYFIIDYIKYKNNLKLDDAELANELYKLSSKFNIRLQLKKVR